VWEPAQELVRALGQRLVQELVLMAVAQAFCERIQS
jgi:hypothetical protein